MWHFKITSNICQRIMCDLGLDPLDGGGPALDPRPPAVPFSHVCVAGLVYDKEGVRGGGGHVLFL